MAKSIQVARDIQSWKSGGNYIAYLDNRDILYVVDIRNGKSERIDDRVAEYQFANATLAFQTKDGTLYFHPLA